jgi:hypothetical protein
LHLDLRLKFLKTLLNVPVWLLDHFLPEREPTFPQTKILDSMYKRMFQAYRLEVAQGVFKEVGKFEGDGNFQRMLRVSQKLLTTIGDDDRYYREWIGLLIILAKEEYDKWLKTLTPAEIKYWCQAQWYVSPGCLSDKAVSEVKEQLAPDVLAYYLHILSRPGGHVDLAALAKIDS